MTTEVFIELGGYLLAAYFIGFIAGYLLNFYKSIFEHFD